jgi:hypothetical protein
VLNTTKYTTYMKWYHLPRKDLPLDPTATTEPLVLLVNSTSRDVWVMNESRLSHTTDQTPPPRTPSALATANLVRFLTRVHHGEVPRTSSMDPPVQPPSKAEKWLERHQTGLIVGVVLFVVVFIALLCIVVLRADSPLRNPESMEQLAMQLGLSSEELVARQHALQQRDPAEAAAAATAAQPDSATDVVSAPSAQSSTPETPLSGPRSTPESSKKRKRGTKPKKD